MSTKGNVLPQYLGSGDPALNDYYPAWLDNMADDATVEGSMLNGAVQGANAVRSVVATIRSLYDRQEHKFAGPYGDNGFLEARHFHVIAAQLPLTSLVDDVATTKRAIARIKARPGVAGWTLVWWRGHWRGWERSERRWPGVCRGVCAGSG